MTDDWARVPVVNDEAHIQRFLGPALEAAGYAPLPARTAAEGLRVAADRSPHAVLLHLGLPDMDGRDVIPRLRALCAVPVKVLWARDQQAAKAAALDTVAGDYIEKPFALGELQARIRAALRGAGELPPQAEFGPRRFGPLKIDFRDHAARLNGEHLRLTPRAWNLLAALARHGEGRLATHRQLLGAV
mgnify:CR=1 FL=1